MSRQSANDASVPDLRFAAEARQDLAEIFRRGLRTGSPEQALASVESIERRCEVFLGNPGLGVALSSDDTLRAFTFDRLITAVFATEGANIIVLRLVPRGANLSQLLAAIRS